jgi:hypothetical protein
LQIRDFFAAKPVKFVLKRAISLCFSKESDEIQGSTGTGVF